MVGIVHITAVRAPARLGTRVTTSKTNRHSRPLEAILLDHHQCTPEVLPSNDDSKDEPDGMLLEHKV